MFQFIKKKLLFILCFVMFAGILTFGAVETKAEDIGFEFGGQSSTDLGWKYSVECWRFTVKQTLNGKQTIKEFTGVLNKHYTITDVPEVIGGTTKWTNTLVVKVDVLEKETGIDIHKGKVEIYADATIRFHHWVKDTAGNKYIDKNNPTPYTTAEAFYAQCEEYGYKQPVRDNYYGYFNRKVDKFDTNVGINKQYYLEVDCEEGIDPNSLKGAGYYYNGEIATASGKAKYGYNYNGDIKVTMNKDAKVTLTATRWSHKVVYDANGGTGAPASFTKTYGKIAFTSSQQPNKPGCTFTGWKSSATGTIYKPGDEYKHAQNGGTDTLIAQWKDNTYTFVFDGNGAKSGSVDSITTTAFNTFDIPANAFVYDNEECNFAGWSLDSGSATGEYKPGDTVKAYDLAVLVGKQYNESATITLYAVWDSTPRITANDRYFPLAHAQEGKISLDELFSQAYAEDTEDGVIPRGTNFYLKDFDASKYTSLTDADVDVEKVFTETFVAKDSLGNEVTKSIEVHVVNTKTRVKDEGNIRFISLKYLDYPPEDGGLLANSFWRLPENYEHLKAVLSLKRENPEVRTVGILGLTYSKEVPGTGTWNGPIKQVWHFEKEDIDDIKDYVDEHGMGNFKEPDALKNFLEIFKHCRIQ